MDAPINIPIDDPHANTEWNEILRKHGVIPQKPPSPTPMIQEAILESQRLAHENRLENKNLDDLDELEDEEDEEFLKQYRTRRLAELSVISAASTFNQVYPLQKPDYSRDVTEASNNAFVLVHLASTNAESSLLTGLWRELAQKFGDVKFCEIRADMCIEGFPEKNTPTILVYRNGDIKKQIVTLRDLRGDETRIADLQHLLINVGAIQANDYRVQLPSSFGNELTERNLRGSKYSNPTADDDDNDWD